MEAGHREALAMVVWPLWSNRRPRGAPVKQATALARYSRKKKRQRRMMETQQRALGTYPTRCDVSVVHNRGEGKKRDCSLERHTTRHSKTARTEKHRQHHKAGRIKTAKGNPRSRNVLELIDQLNGGSRRLTTTNDDSVLAGLDDEIRPLFSYDLRGPRRREVADLD